MWTRFMDMNSGGGLKEDFEYCYIEAPKREAMLVFYNRFGHNPERVSCTCCGSDYSISEEVDLYQATGHERGCSYELGKYIEQPKRAGKYITLPDFVRQVGVCVIYEKDINADEKTGELPEQGFVWV